MRRRNKGMNEYVIFTDSAADLKPEVLNEWGVGYDELTFRFDTEDKSYRNFEMPASEFYEKMKGGAVAKTAAINPDAFTASFEKILKEGKDILYIGFSSGLSTTYNSAHNRNCFFEETGKYFFCHSNAKPFRYTFNNRINRRVTYCVNRVKRVQWTR